MANEWKRIGSVLTSKKNKGEFYIKLNENVTLTKEDVIQLQDPRKSLAKAVEAGRMSEDRAEELLSKIPEFVKYELVLPPRK